MSIERRKLLIAGGMAAVGLFVPRKVVAQEPSIEQQRQERLAQVLADWPIYMVHNEPAFRVRNVIRWNLDLGKACYTAHQFGEMQRGKYPIPEKGGFTLTFDDRFSVQFDEYVPILDQLGVNATFAVMSQVWPITKGYASLEKALEVYKRGDEIACHTHNHPRLAIQHGHQDGVLNAELFEAQAEIEKSLDPLKKTPGEKQVWTIVYPYGDYNPHILDLVSEIDPQTGLPKYKQGLSTRQGRNHSLGELYFLKRVGFYQNPQVGVTTI